MSNNLDDLKTMLQEQTVAEYVLELEVRVAELQAVVDRLADPAVFNPDEIENESTWRYWDRERTARIELAAKHATEKPE